MRDSIVVTDLRKAYGQVRAVDGITVSVHSGEVFGLLGPNGAGKTTTLEILIGLVKRDAGNVSILGLDPAKDATTIKARIGVQLQTVAMLPRLTVKETLRLYAVFFPSSFDVGEIMKEIGLQEKANEQVRRLSGGQLQRLSVALALICDGEIYFLDEPTAGLDPQARQGLWGIIRTLRSAGKTVFITTHFMDEAEKLCDRVAILDYGRIIALDSPRTIIHHTFPETAIDFRASARAPTDAYTKMPGVARMQADGDLITLFSTDAGGTINALMEQAGRSGGFMDGLTVRTATLEDVFLKLTGRRIRE